MGCPTVPWQDEKWLFPRTILGGPGGSVCSSRSSNKSRDQFNIGKERSNLFLPYIALKGWFIFYFCYTVGLCWLSILNVAMCTRSKS